MSDWVQESFSPLRGAELPSRSPKPSWMTDKGVIEFGKASLDWLLDLKYRIQTGQEVLPRDKRERALKAIDEELKGRVRLEKYYTPQQVQQLVRKRLLKVIKELGKMRDSAKATAELHESLYGSDPEYFAKLDQSHFLYGLRDYIDRLAAADMTEEDFRRVTR